MSGRKILKAQPKLEMERGQQNSQNGNDTLESVRMEIGAKSEDKIKLNSFAHPRLSEAARKTKISLQSYPLDKFEFDRAANEMAEMKWTALQKGTFSDCEFLVGKEDYIYASKCDLIGSSDTFAAMFRSPYTENGKPIRITNVKPHIFRIMIKFLHTCSINRYEVRLLEDFLDLAVAADMFLIEPLKVMNLARITKLLTEKNVWKVLDVASALPGVPDLCKKILSSKTEDCLAQPSFLEIKQSTLEFFLKIDALNIESEFILVEACIKLAKAKNGENRSMMDVALPFLRLLTLKAEELPQLSAYLTDKEKKALGQWHVFNESEGMPDRICSIKEARQKPLLQCQVFQIGQVTIDLRRLDVAKSLNIKPK